MPFIAIPIFILLIGLFWKTFLPVALVLFIATSLFIGWFIYLGWKSKRRERQEEIRKIRNLMQSRIHEIDEMTGEQFEEFMYFFFRKSGWDVKRTPHSSDYGADLLVKSPQGKTICIQLKRYSKPVGVSAVQEVIAASKYYKTDDSMLITNSTLTRNAVRLAAESDVHVWDRERLISQLASENLKEMRETNGSGTRS
ncbi:restriction endonuclease [Alicyclobacillus acidoterrestris]|uniref:Restriction endonuclease n=1 Tax=Alicyclobacillus acidoterrestris (strain ATCC 49025 / DSM 3922 / CIP 106132 / NCIMB 13137 / GD3B) TaxID=1356854 RepID=T0BB59_ALIAG|nr:restriction endonuclease [Alicyclobacillus acidoterrestris]EPZ41273.1 hypothetical protein N007_01930 [Alicyclobacillus acidoterrestris ATCC 49025]UNO49015.1 restriction endonuclease [Alicyclobacillus acidoterrestris]